MTDVAACPDEKELLSFVAGKHLASEVERLAEHIEQCTRCAEVLDQLIKADTVMARLGDQTRVVQKRKSSTLDSLIEKLSALPTVAADTLIRSDDATIIPDKSSAEIFNLLGPAETDQELGRLASYRILSVLGQGGMGIVFLAEDLLLRRPVALKVMNPSAASNPEAKQRFLREAQAAAAVVHDHVVSIYQVEEDRGIPFLAMPLLQGETLEARLRRVGRLPVEQTLRIAREIAEGLSAAHNRGLVHRDIKPANVFIESGSDRVKIVDFGLARCTNDDVRLTHTGTIMGTPAYMAPEQARGGEVDARSDLFSLGCVVYRMCTGNVAFQAPDVLGTLSALALHTPTAPREINGTVPQELSDIVMQLLAKDPLQRPSSAREVADRISAVELRRGNPSGPEVAVPQSVVADRKLAIGPTSPRRRRWGAVAAMLVLGGGAILASQIIIKIRDRNGSETAVEIQTKKGSTTTINVDGEEVVRITSNAESDDTAATAQDSAVHGEPVAIEPEPLPEFAPGAPLSPLALVTEPAPLAGIRSWTIDTRGSRSMITAIAYAADGNFVATSSLDGSLRIFEVESGKLSRVLVTTSGDCAVVGWSLDGRRLACGHGDGAVRIWDVESGRLLRTMREHAQSISALIWSPDGSRLATGSYDKTVKIWDVSKGRLRDTLQLHNGRITSVAWSRNGKLIASASEDKTVRLWDAQTGNHLKNMNGLEASASALAFSPDSFSVVAGSDDKTLVFWKTDSGTSNRKIADLGQPAKALVWLADGETLGAGLADGTARLIEIETGRTLRGVRAEIGDGAVSALSPDGRTFSVGRADGALHVWEIRSGKRVVEIAGHKVRTPTWNNSMPPLAWSPDGKTLGFGTLNSYIDLWDLATPGLLRKFKPLHTGPIVTLVWSPDSRRIASGGSDNTVRIWDVTTGEQLLVCAHSGWIAGLAWSPDGKTIASGGQDSTVRLWDSSSGRELQKLEGHKVGVQALAWSPDSKRLISSSYDQTLRIWDTGAGKELTVFERDSNDQPLGENRAASWSSDGKTIAAGGWKLWLWDPESGKIRQTLDGAGFRNAVFSPDGGRLASGFTDGTARIFDTDSGKMLRKLAGPAGSVDAVTWSPNSKALACSTVNFWTIDQIRVWDAASGKLLAVITPLADPHGVAFSPAGHFRFTPGIEGEFVYVAQTEAGQETLSFEQFSKRFDWKNDPQSIRFGVE